MLKSWRRRRSRADPDRDDHPTCFSLNSASRETRRTASRTSGAQTKGRYSCTLNTARGATHRRAHVWPAPPPGRSDPASYVYVTRDILVPTACDATQTQTIIWPRTYIHAHTRIRKQCRPFFEIERTNRVASIIQYGAVDLGIVEAMCTPQVGFNETHRCILA